MTQTTVLLVYRSDSSAARGYHLAGNALRLGGSQIRGEPSEFLCRNHSAYGDALTNRGVDLFTRDALLRGLIVQTLVDRVGESKPGWTTFSVMPSARAGRRASWSCERQRRCEGRISWTVVPTRHRC